MLENHHFNLDLVFTIAMTFWIIFLIVTRKIIYNGPNTDNEKQVYAASTIKKWRWFSDMHRLGAQKTYMKDGTVLMISFFQGIFNNYWGDYPVTSASSFSVAISGIMLYLIGANYLGPFAGLIIALLFLISVWPWQVALFGGHINVAIVFFLLSIYFMQSSQTGILPQNVWLLIAGALFCLSLFSSASSSKFIIPFLAALFYEANKSIIGPNYVYTALAEALKKDFSLLSLAIPAFFIIVFLIIITSYKKIVNLMYYQKAPRILNKLISGRGLFPLEYYIQHARKKIYAIIFPTLLGLILLFIIYNLIGFDYSAPTTAGALLMFVLLTLPDVKTGIRNYLFYLFHSHRKTHFRLYVDYFAKKNISVDRATRGGGHIWLPLLLWRIIPLHILISLAALTYLLLIKPMTYSDAIILALMSLSPYIWGEITYGVQVGRSYLPGLVTM